MPVPRAGGGGSDELRRFRRLADLTALATFALIALGGVVRVSESGLGCDPGSGGTDGWPLCNGSAVPFFGDHTVIIEFSHRVLAAVVTGLIVVLAWTAYKHLRGLRWPLRASIAAAALVLVQAGLGGLTVEHSLAEELVAAHLGLAMVLLGLLLWIAVRARAELAPFETTEASAGDERVRGLKPFAGTAAVLLICAIVAGGYVAGTEEEGVDSAHNNIAGAHLACGEQFPGCLNRGVAPFGESRLSDIQLTHRMFVYAATIAVLVLLGVAFARGSRSRLLLLGLLLLVAQFTLGVLNVLEGEHAWLIVAHLITATLLWSSVLLIAFRLAWAPQASAESARMRAGSAETATAGI
jgi:heme a synthase